MSLFQDLGTYAQQSNDGDLGFRTLKKLETTHGAYLNIQYKGQKLYLVVGTKEAPVTTPLGVKTFDDDSSSKPWSSCSVVLSGDLTNQIKHIDDGLRQLLADNSEQLFGKKKTADQIHDDEIYQPILYSKEDNDLNPLLGGKVTADTQLVSATNEIVDIKSLHAMSEAVPPNSIVRIIFKVESMFFKTKNCVKPILKVAKIQLLEQGAKQPGVEDFMFD